MQYVVMSDGYPGGERGALVELTPDEVNAAIAEGVQLAHPHQNPAPPDASPDATLEDVAPVASDAVEVAEREGSAAEPS